MLDSINFYFSRNMSGYGLIKLETRNLINFNSLLDFIFDKVRII